MRSFTGQLTLFSPDIMFTYVRLPASRRCARTRIWQTKKLHQFNNFLKSFRSWCHILNHHLRPAGRSEQLGCRHHSLEDPRTICMSSLWSQRPRFPYRDQEDLKTDRDVLILCSYWWGHDNVKLVYLCTDDFDVDGGAGSSEFVLQCHFVLSCISVNAAVNLQVTGSILLPVEHKQSHQPLLLTLTSKNTKHKRPWSRHKSMKLKLKWLINQLPKRTLNISQANESRAGTSDSFNCWLISLVY